MRKQEQFFVGTIHASAVGKTLCSVVVILLLNIVGSYSVQSGQVEKSFLSVARANPDTPQVQQMPALHFCTLARPTNILLLGTDVVYTGQQRHRDINRNSLNGNSDTIMLAFLNPPQNKAAILHIPRDTEAYVGKFGIRKINSANPLGGPELAKSTVAGLLNVPVDHHIILNIHGLVQLVDELGGITVAVPKKMSYTDWTAKLKIDLQPGIHTLTGNQAMGFVRFRHDGLGDIGRVQRQQIFMQAVARKMSQPGSWMHLPALLDIAHNNVQSDMNQIDLLLALNFLHSLPKEDIKFVLLPGQFAHNGDWIASSDGRAIASQCANPDQERASSRRNISVSITSATSDHTLSTKLAQSLRTLGYKTRIARDDKDSLHKNTQIIVQNGNTANAAMLQQDLGNVGDVVNASVGSLNSSITIVAHDDLKLDKVTLSSADAPFAVHQSPPEPIVTKLRRRNRLVQRATVATQAL